VGPLRADFRVGENSELDSVVSASPDATLTIPLSSVIDAAEDPDRAAGKIASSGDADLAEAVTSLARVTPWLLESELARVVGPIAARRLAEGARGAIRLPAYAADRFAANVRSYARDETSAIVRRGEFERFAGELRELEARTEALAAGVENSRT
jgi:ubiquinone biosynthesis protein UbiJ